MESRPPGLIIAAPASGSGKTILTLGVLRALRRAGVDAAPFKTGPDYIDAAYLAAAAGRDCINLDCWSMRPETLGGLIAGLEAESELIIGEGVMGLFDGAPAQTGSTTGSTADLAALTGWPVILVVDVRGQAASAAAVVRGFAGHREDVTLAGVIFNRVGGPGHAETLRASCAEATGIAVLGCVPRQEALTIGERHLGLIQAAEQDGLSVFMDGAAALVAEHIDLDGLRGLAKPSAVAEPGVTYALAPLGQRIAVARDVAFAFAYPWLLDAWRRAGAEITVFSPLADEAPDETADAIYLPGGYPELHAGRIAANDGFMAGLRDAAARGVAIYGECGGYMVLGGALTDADGVSYPMAGLLPVAASFAERRLHLGYRRLTLLSNGPLGRVGARFRGHEFHYATILHEGGLHDDGATPLFEGADARGKPLAPLGSVAGSVSGSFAHLVDRADD